MKHLNILLILTALFLLECTHKNAHHKVVVKKYSDTDRFKNNMVESQFYTFSPSRDNVIESKQGNLIMIPTNAFTDVNDEPVKDSIQIELAEVSEISDMITSNVVMQDHKAIMETHEAFFINATRKGEQLYINKQHPLYVEIRTDKKLNLYKGTRNNTGDMHWDSVINPVKYLLPVPMEMLSFYPPRFEAAVEGSLPYKNYKVLTKALLDSLYDSFSFATARTAPNKYNKLLRINLFVQLSKLFSEDKTERRKYANDTTLSACGINPASIRAISDKKFQNTFISTREFEMRLQLIFGTCDNRVLELYVNNLDKNLWEIDQMAADLLGSNYGYEFAELAELKQTTVKITDKQAKALADFYLNKKEKIEKSIASLKQEIQAKIEKQEKNFQKQAEAYESLLQDRHDYRMKKFGFELTDLGWYNAASRIELKQLKTFELNVTVDNGNDFERAYVYVVNPQIKSIFSMLASDHIHFNQVYSDDPDLLLWENQKFTIIGIGYKNETIGYKIGEYTQQPVINASFALDDKTMADLKKALKVFDRGYRNENKILTDLDYQEIFHKEAVRKQKEDNESLIREKLRRIIFACCYADLKEAAFANFPNVVSPKK